MNMHIRAILIFRQKVNVVQSKTNDCVKYSVVIWSLEITNMYEGRHKIFALDKTNKENMIINRSFKIPIICLSIRLEHNTRVNIQ